MPAKRKVSAKDPSSSATVGFEANLWLAADIRSLAPHGMAGFIIAQPLVESRFRLTDA